MSKAKTSSGAAFESAVNKFRKTAPKAQQKEYDAIAAAGTKRVRLKLRDMILWAKDRLVDDLQGLVDDFNQNSEVNYAFTSHHLRKKFNERMLHLATLLNLPNDDYKTLVRLQQASYWNGEEDTLFEENDPPKDYAVKMLDAEHWAGPSMLVGDRYV